MFYGLSYTTYLVEEFMSVLKRLWSKTAVMNYTLIALAIVQSQVDLKLVPEDVGTLIVAGLNVLARIFTGGKK